MSDETSTPEAGPLQLSSKPRAITRINRKVVIAGFGLGALAVFAAASIALTPPRASDPNAARELYNTKNVRPPEALSALPSSYSSIAPLEDRVIRLGPPQTGDLGGTIARFEEDLGVEYEPIAGYAADFRPNPEDEAARALRIETAKLEAQAAAAPIFFSIDAKQADTSRAQTGQVSSIDPAAELFALASAGIGAHPPAIASTQDSNLQSRKRGFAAEVGSPEIYNQASLELPRSPYQVMSGTSIPASLVTGLNSDLPGSVIAQVTQPVYDTVTGTHLLIPQGSRLLGRYQSEVSFGQDRALVTWDRIIFPDGSSILISAPGADAAGFAGLSDRTDHHWGRVFAAAGLATILGIGAELGSDDDDLERAIRRGFGDSVSEAGQRIVDRNLNIQPTIKVRPGAPLRVIVTRDLILRPH